MANKKETPTLKEGIAGLLKEKEFVLHCIDIKSSTEFFNQLNEHILDSLLENAKNTKSLSEQDAQDFSEMMRQHFNEIKHLREMYDNLKKI